MQATYWKAECYIEPTKTIRAKTKREIIEEMMNRGENPKTTEEYGSIHRATIGYSSIVDLINQCCTIRGGLED